MKIQNRFIIVIVFVLTLASCRSLSNGGAVDWATVEFSVNQPSQAKAAVSYSAAGNRTSLIVAVPVSETSIGTSNYLKNFYDAQLLNDTDNSVKLRIPLNSELCLIKVLFEGLYTLNQIYTDQPAAFCIGLSDHLSLKGNESRKSVMMSMDACRPRVSTTSPVDSDTNIAVDTDIVMTFSRAMNTSTLTTNINDTTCSGSIQLSADGFSSCIRMSASPTATNNDQTFTVSPFADLSNATPYTLKVTTDASSAQGFVPGDDFSADFTTITYSALGVLDTSFNSVGYMLHHDAGGGNGWDFAHAITQDSNGRILVCGESENGIDFDFVVWRYNTDGTLDSSFGTGGIVVQSTIAGTAGNDDCYGIIVDSQDRIVAVGNSQNAINQDIVVLRFDEDGNLDTSFNSGGILIVDSPAGSAGNDYCWGGAIAIDETGNILVGGHGGGVGSDDAVVLRISDDGTLDLSFDSDGIAILVDPAGGVGTDSIYGITIDANGRILVTGSSNNGVNFDMFFARLNSDGSLDTTLNTSGIVTHDNAAGGNGSDSGSDILVDESGNIYVSGDSSNGGTGDMALWRYHADGSPDSTFGTGGYAVYIDTVGFNGFETGDSLALDAFGRIVVGGSTQMGSPDDMLIWRYNSDGTLDSTFGTDGLVNWDNTAGGSMMDIADQILVTSDQRILAAGNSWNTTGRDMIIWRYE